MKGKNRVSGKPYKGANLPPSEEELFQLEFYALIEKNDTTAIWDNSYPEIIHMMHSELLESEKEFVNAHRNLDWKKIQFLADKQRDGALYTGATRLVYACQFLERYCSTNQTDLREALYEQAVNVIVQTRDEIKTLGLP